MFCVIQNLHDEGLWAFGGTLHLKMGFFFFFNVYSFDTLLINKSDKIVKRNILMVLTILSNPCISIAHFMKDFI